MCCALMLQDLVQADRVSVHVVWNKVDYWQSVFMWKMSVLKSVIHVLVGSSREERELCKCNLTACEIVFALINID